VENHCVRAEGRTDTGIEFQAVPDFLETGKEGRQRRVSLGLLSRRFGGRNGSQVALNAILRSVLKEMGKGMSSLKRCGMNEEKVTVELSAMGWHACTLKAVSPRQVAG